MVVARSREVPDRRLGIRTRITVAFGLLALFLSFGLALLVWTVVTDNLTSQLRSTALAESDLARRQLQVGLNAGLPATLPEFVQALNVDPSVITVAQVRGEAASSSSRVSISELPPSLLSGAGQPSPDLEQIEVGGRTYLAVSRPLTSGVVVQLYSMRDVRSAEHSLLLTLAGSAVLTSLIGVGLGKAVGHRVLSPLTKVNRAAAEVAAGNLDARLDAGGDPDLAEVAQSFNATVADLRRRVAADARFAVDVSHELRTPLTTMLNSVQVIQHRKDLLPTAVREPLDLLADEIARFRHLVVDLLEISRSEAGDGLTLDRVAIADLVRRAADAEAGRPVTHIDPSADGVLMRADKRRVERIVANLVENAETHGRGCRGVEVSSDRKVLTVTVDDAGTGVSPAQRDRIFERFARGSTERHGFGLGLAIVQGHTRLHRGQVEVCTSPFGGARFVVRLPLDPE